MPAKINTFGETVAAKVIRIDPIVTEGRVMVELDLLGELPSNARPDLTVEGDVLVKQIDNALYVEQPSHSTSFKSKKIFKLSQDQKTAQLTLLEFGTLSGTQIQILNGAQRGDKLIVSDMTQWDQQLTVQLQD